MIPQSHFWIELNEWYWMRAEWPMNCGLKKKKEKGKHKSKDMDKAQESPGSHWVGPGESMEMLQTREVYTANGLYYRWLAV